MITNSFGYSFAGKKFLVVGASGTLGRELVAELIEGGAELFLLGRDSAKKLAKDLVKQGHKVHYSFFDLDEDVMTLLPQICLDGVFYCVGNSQRVFDSTGLEVVDCNAIDLENSLYVDGLRMVIDLCRGRMQKKCRYVVAGSIISERSGIKGMPQIAYRAAKVAQKIFVEKLRNGKLVQSGNAFIDLYHFGPFRNESNRREFDNLRNKPGVPLLTRFLLGPAFNFISLPMKKAVAAMLSGFGSDEHQTKEILK